MIKFPEDFILRPHPLSEMGGEYINAKQWTYQKLNGTMISIVGGAPGLYGDGIETFEYWDFDDDDVMGWLSKDGINEILSNIDMVEPNRNSGDFRF